MNDPDDLIVVARIVKARGLRGEVVADLLTDFPDRFENLESLTGISAEGEQRSLQIEEQGFHGRRVETISGTQIGEVTEVMHPGGVEMLKVVDESARDRLIPMAADIVVEID